jgi:hypothetical protein
MNFFSRFGGLASKSLRPGDAIRGGCMLYGKEKEALHGGFAPKPRRDVMSDYDYPDADAIPSSKPKPAMANHAQRVLCEAFTVKMLTCLARHDRTVDDNYKLAHDFYTQARAAGRREGLEALAWLLQECTARGDQYDIARYLEAVDNATAVLATAKEAGHVV